MDPNLALVALILISVAFIAAMSRFYGKGPARSSDQATALAAD